MSYLYDLIQSLDATELKVAEQTPVIGMEQTVLLFFIRNKNSAEESSISGSKRFGLSVTHFDKIKSVLLSKVYQQLVPEMGWNLLSFLDSKRVLYHLFYRELLQQEKHLLATKPNKKKLYAFYHQAFLMCSNLPLKFLDDKINTRIAKQFLRYSENEIDEVM